MKELYIVDFKYTDVYSNKTYDDRWILACNNYSELDEIMKLNIKEFNSNGYSFNEYRCNIINETDNGYKVLIK